MIGLYFRFVDKLQLIISSLAAMLVATDGTVSLTSSLKLNDKHKYGLTTELKMSRHKSHMIVSPFVQITTDSQTVDLVAGTVKILKYRRLEFDIEVKNITKYPVTINGE